MRAFRIILWGGVIAFIGATVAAYPALPAQIPQGIDANGEATRLVARSPLAWGFSAGLLVAVVLLLEAIRARLPRQPELFNFPGKDELLALPAEYRTEAIRYMQLFMDIITLELLITFSLVQWMLWRAAHGLRSETLTMALFVVPAMIVVAVGLFLVRMQTVVDEARRRYESRRNPLG